MLVKCICVETSRGSRSTAMHSWIMDLDSDSTTSSEKKNSDSTSKCTTTPWQVPTKTNYFVILPYDEKVSGTFVDLNGYIMD